MEPFGTRLQGVGTATAATAVVSVGLSGGIDIFVTDIAASSDVGTAEVQVIDGKLGTGSVIWNVTIPASSSGGPYVQVFGRPLRCDGTVTVYISGSGNYLKTVNVAGYIT